MGSIHRWPVRLVPALFIAAMATAMAIVPLASAAAAPVRTEYACGLEHNDLASYATIPAKCGHKGEGAAPRTHQPPDHSLSNVVSRTVLVARPKTLTAVNHRYTAVGNTPFGVGTTPAAPAATVRGSLLDGDTDPDPTATLTVIGNTAPAHGTVSVNRNGTFTYRPNRGYTGTDRFRYTIAGSNAPGRTATATVTITLHTVVWYVNDSYAAAGNGKAATPFNTLAAANRAAGPNSVIFLYKGDAPYTGGVTMKPGQDLYGRPHGLIVSGYSLVSPAKFTPTITNGSGDGIDLAEGVNVEGVNVASASGNGIAAVNVDQATIGASSPVAISGAGGDGILIAGGGGNLNFGATSVTGSAGDPVSVASRNAGTVTFGGRVTGTGTGISLTGNTGASIAFTGRLTVSTDGAAFTATGGGTVTATGTGSTLGSLVQTVLTVQNTTIGAAGLTFQSVSSNGSYTNGIDLADTGSRGGLTVTGTGTAGSGGTIQNSQQAGIQLTSTHTPSLTDMVIENNAVDGINGSLVNGLTLAGSVVSGNGSVDNAANGGLDFSPNGTGSPDGLTGTVSITNSTITDSAGDEASISDTSGTLDLTVSGITCIGSFFSPTDGLAIDADGTANATVSVTGSTFIENGHAFEFATATGSTGTSRVTFAANTLDSNGSAPGGGSVLISPYGNSRTAVSIDRNDIQDTTGEGIEIDEEGTSGTLTGTVHGNVVGTPIAGGPSGAGIGVSAQGSGTETLAITGNNLYQYSSPGGINFLDQGGNPTMNLTITGNLITDPAQLGIGVPGTWGILGQDGAVTGDNGTVCAVITGNSIVGSGEDGQEGQPGGDIELEQNDATTFELPGYAGAADDTGLVQGFLQGNNNLNGTPTATASVSGSGAGFVGGAGC